MGGIADEAGGERSVAPPGITEKNVREPSMPNSFSTAAEATSDAAAARIEEALAWLRAQVAGDADALAGVVKLRPTPSGVLAIETARAAVEACEASRVATATARAADARASASAGNALSIAAGISESHDTPHQLALACAALGLREDAASAGARAAAAGALAADVLRARAASARAQAALLDANTDARVAACALADARRDARALRDGTSARTHAGARDWDRVAVFDAKRAEYAEGASTAKRTVRASGVDTRCTHDAVASRAQAADDMREAVANDRSKAARYRGLPSDIELARKEIDRMRQEVRAADERIQRALRGIMD